jgi:hypothetical protein
MTNERHDRRRRPTVARLRKTERDRITHDVLNLSEDAFADYKRVIARHEQLPALARQMAEFIGAAKQAIARRESK